MKYDDSALWESEQLTDPEKVNIRRLISELLSDDETIYVWSGKHIVYRNHIGNPDDEHIMVCQPVMELGLGWSYEVGRDYPDPDREALSYSL